MILENMISSVLYRMKSAEIISESDEDIYRFGLECFLLKIIHYLSYLFISIMLHMAIPMLVSATILMPLRKRTGGYHAKTRFGCYLFSCSIVLLLCILNKTIFPTVWFWLVFVMVNVVIGYFSPIENCNRKLSETEQSEFKGQALLLLGVADIAIFVTVAMGYEASQWLLNGLLITAALILLGRCANLDV